MFGNKLFIFILCYIFIILLVSSAFALFSKLLIGDYSFTLAVFAGIFVGLLSGELVRRLKKHINTKKYYVKTRIDWSDGRLYVYGLILFSHYCQIYLWLMWVIDDLLKKNVFFASAIIKTVKVAKIMAK